MLDISLEGDKHYDMWICLVREALSCLDLDSSNWVHLPNAGGYYDQDEFIIRVWEQVRYEYIAAKRDPGFKKSLEIKNKGK
jgi:hypothetical protein